MIREFIYSSSKRIWRANFSITYLCNALITVKLGDIKTMAEKACHLIKNRDFLVHLWKNAVKYSSMYDWEQVVISEYMAYLKVLNCETN